MLSYIAIAAPFLLLITMVVGARRPLWQAGLAAFLLAAGIWAFVFHQSLQGLAAPVGKAVLVSTEIALILLGAIVFQGYLKASGRSESLRLLLKQHVSSDRTVQTLLFAWLLWALIEGASGFGTPAAVVAPLLLSLGLPPVSAAVLPLIGNSVAVPFGAVGTPIRIGLAGLPTEGLPLLVACINLSVGILFPLFIIYRVRGAGVEPRTEMTAKDLRLVVAAFLCFALPAVAISLLGPEFPSLVGGLVGMGAFLAFTQRQQLRAGLGAALFEIFRGLTPYLLLCAILITGKIVLGGHRVSLGFISSKLDVTLFQPGLAFFVTLFTLRACDARSKRPALAPLLSGIGQRLGLVWFAIFFMTALAQLTVVHLSPAFLSSLAPDGGTALQRGLLVLAAPFLGAFGSFVAGSATVSNLMFGAALHQMAQALGVDALLVLALQLSGAGAGNMVAFQNLVAVQSTVGIANQERAMLQQLWWPCLSFVAALSLAGLCLHWAIG